MYADAGFSGFIPYSSLIRPDVIVCKGGELLASWQIDGLPFLGVSDAELRQQQKVLVGVINSLRAPEPHNVGIWLHERRQRKSQDAAFAMEWHLTLVYRPSDRHYLNAANASELHTALDHSCAKLYEMAATLERGLGAYRPRRLGTDAQSGRSTLLAFLASLLGASAGHPLTVPPGPIHQSLATDDVIFDPTTGVWQQRGATQGQYGALLQIREFPEQTQCGMLDTLKTANFQYLLTVSFCPMGTQQALRTLDRAKGRLWSAGDKATSQLTALTEAMDAVASGSTSFGEMHFSLAVHGQTDKELEQAVADARAVLVEAGLGPVRESGFPVAAYFAQLPANWSFRPRTSVVSALNAFALGALHGEWRGKAEGNPWGNCIAELKTVSGQCFNFNFHATDPGRDCKGERTLGNTLVIGKSGTGKTALVNFLLASAGARVAGIRTVIFDKDFASYVFVTELGGRYLALRHGHASGINPLQLAASERNTAFQLLWLSMLVARPLSAAEESELRQALQAMQCLQLELRTIHNLREMLPNRGTGSVFELLHRWLAGQALGWAFDHGRCHQDLFNSALVGLDYTEIIDDPLVRGPILACLLHELEERLDGRPLIYAMDEFWKAIGTGHEFADFARNKQKTIRKQNALGIFASQSPEDALRSPIAAALIEQTATLILLPNPSASREDYCDGLKLTEAEFRLLLSLNERSRMFLVKQGGNCAVCTLDLSGSPQVLSILAADTATVRRYMKKEAVA